MATFGEMVQDLLTLVGMPDDGNNDPRSVAMARGALNLSQKILATQNDWLLLRRSTTLAVSGPIVLLPTGCEAGSIKSAELVSGGAVMALRQTSGTLDTGKIGFPTGWRYERGSVLKGITVTSKGTGAVVGQNLTIGQPIGSLGQLATAQVSAIGSSGEIEGIKILSPGWGYDLPPVVAAETPSTGAVLTAMITTGWAMRLTPMPSQSMDLVIQWVAKPTPMILDEDEPGMDDTAILLHAAISVARDIGTDQDKVEDLTARARDYLTALRPRCAPGSATLDLDPQRARGGWAFGGRR